jgi:hypothetical protein
LQHIPVVGTGIGNIASGISGLRGDVQVAGGMHVVTQAANWAMHNPQAALHNAQGAVQHYGAQLGQVAQHPLQSFANGTVHQVAQQTAAAAGVLSHVAGVVGGALDVGGHLVTVATGLETAGGGAAVGESISRAGTAIEGVSSTAGSVQSGAQLLEGFAPKGK